MLQYNNNVCACTKYHNRAVTIDAVIVTEGRILLIKRGLHPYKGYWALPGGHLDYDETIENAVTREVKEETGLDVISLTFLGIYSTPKRHPLQTVAIAYMVNVLGEAHYGSDAVGLNYFSIDRLPEQLAFDHRQMIDDYKEKHKV